MTVPFLIREEFFNLLQENGFEIVNSDFWDEYNRVIFKKDGFTFPLQVKKSYFFIEVCHICNDFGIEPPADHKKVFEQLKNRKKE